MNRSKRLILFFVKFPDPGRVKIRLSRVLGDERGAAIHRSFVLDMLISFGRETFAPSVFRGMAWGGNSVFRSTRSAVEEMGHRLHILFALNDIDTHEDLINLYHPGKGTDFARSRTMTCLASLLDADGQGASP